MKIITSLVAIAVLAGSAAFAADPPATPSATPLKHSSLKVCNKQADARELTGTARTQFMKDCRANKTS